jgi:hypothetical protein
MKTLERRIYHSLGELLTDFRIIVSRRKEIRSLMRGKIITPAKRYRMGFHKKRSKHWHKGCFAHAREALSNGIPQEEIEALAQGMFEGSPSEEVPALLYAQHWAEANGEPEAPVREQMVAQYGERVVEMMELALRMIRAGNLSGNTFDYLLHRISFGRWGA